MKILFLDIDGVVNSRETFERSPGFIGIDRGLAMRVARIIAYTDCKVVLSSSWRLMPDSRKEVKERVCPFIDVTPYEFDGDYINRGEEIQDWLNKHPEVEKYAILDDVDEMLDIQQPNFFKTTFEKGLTEEIMNKVIAHLNT